MKWIAGEKGQQRVADGGRMCNVPEAIRKFWLPSGANVAGAEAFVKAIEGASINLASEVTENVLNRDAGLAQALSDVRSGKATPKDALDASQPRIQQVLDSYWATSPPADERSPSACRRRAPGRPPRRRPATAR